MRRRSLLFRLARPTYAYEVWDVFTRTPLTGNPLCIFTDARGMSDAEMQAVARETNLSETTFVLPAADPARVRVRIFSPVTEYPFAGHPTLGTALALRRRGMRRIVLQENIGPIPVEFSGPESAVRGDMLQTDPVFAETHEPAVIARLLGCPVSAFLPDRPIVNVSTGRPNLIVCFRNLAALRSVRPDWPAIAAYFQTGDRERGFYFLTPEVEDRSALLHARKLNPRGEDPATGSAAGCAIAYAVRQGMAKSGESYWMEQGTEARRPSQLFVSARLEADKITGVRVGGYAVPVMKGRLALPAVSA
jgi:trans-2,3-dihydro-3-hydroxyanthranilate isomerase